MNLWANAHRLDLAAERGDSRATRRSDAMAQPFTQDFTEGFLLALFAAIYLRGLIAALRAFIGR